MLHSFDVAMAKRVGVNAAIIFQNIVFWCEHSEANECHYHDGRYWTFNSVKAFEDMFPYMGTRAIRSAIEKLKTEGLIVVGNYNNSTYDRTTWYALTEKAKSICQNATMHSDATAGGGAATADCICQKSKMDLSETANLIIYNNNIDCSTDINTDIKQSGADAPTPPVSRSKKSNVDESICKLFSDYTKDAETLELLTAWLEVRTKKRTPNTQTAIELNLRKLDRMASESRMTVQTYLQEIIARGWAAFYAIKDFNRRSPEPPKDVDMSGWPV